MRGDYPSLVNPLLDLQELAGDRAQPERRAELEARYAEAVDAFVASLIAERLSQRALLEQVDHDIDELIGVSDSSMRPLFDKIRYDLISRIEDETGPTPGQRAMRTRLIGIGGVALVVLLVAGYFGLREYNSIPITAALETREGIEQRADAFHKVVNFAPRSDVNLRGGGVIRNILRWPFEPNEAEIKGARELAAAILGGAELLAQRNEACNLPAVGTGELSLGEVEMVRAVADQIRADKLAWGDPPWQTILDALKSQYPCEGQLNPSGI